MLTQDSLSLLTSDHYASRHDPRLTKNIKLIKVLEPIFNDPDSEPIAQSYLKDFDEWAKFSPPNATRAIKTIPASHPIWKYKPETPSAPSTSSP